MRIVPTKTHGALDYLTGAALLALPKALGLEEVPSSARPQACRRRGNRLQSADGLRDGVAKLLPMSVHLALDAASSALLASSPWPFGFARNGTRYWLQPVLVGAQEILAAATTDALINKAIPVTAPEAGEDGERQPKGGRNR